MPGEDFQFHIEVSPNPEHQRFIQGLLREHNHRTSTVRGPDAQPLNIQVVDDKSTRVGGLVALTYWGWLVIELLALEVGVQRQGLGTQLVNLAEAEARRRGCTRAHTTTYAHQALDFYRKLGYHIAGQLDDYPYGYTLYWLRKEL